MINPITNILLNARSSIIKGWCQNQLSKDADGNPVPPISKQAVCWCLEGSIRSVDVNGWYVERVLAIVHDAISVSGYELPSKKNSLINAWNDEKFRTQQDIINLLDNILKARKVSIDGNTIFFEDAIQSIREKIQCATTPNLT